MIRSLSKRWLRRVGLWVAQSTPEAELLRLIQRLRPMRTEHPLVRLGAEGDGGYLVPDDLEGVVACFSPGVAREASFERALLARGARCFLADASVSQPPLQDARVDFERKHLGVIDDEHTLTMDQWLSRAPDGDLLLQMDIEGAEYSVLLATTPDALRRFRIIVVEVHQLDGLFDRGRFRFFASFFRKLLHDFHVVHLHPNNRGVRVSGRVVTVPELLELTLLRRDRASELCPVKVGELPHPLDRPNVRDAPELTLSDEWLA